MSKTTLKTYTDEELRQARKGGFKRAKLKKPKAGATLTQLENYVSRHNKWVDDMKEKAKQQKAREELSKRIHK